MKIKSLISLFVLLSALFGLNLTVVAQESGVMPVPSDKTFPPIQSDLFFGQNHYYAAIFRGNGEAIVYAKLVLTNTNDTPLTQFSFDMPRAQASELVLFQQILPQQCVRYDYQTPGQPCLEYQDPDYNPYYYGGTSSEYKKIQYTQSGNLYQFTLPNPVNPNKTTAIVTAYAARGYVKESFGLFNFNFETLKVPSRISNIRVAVDVDTDLFIKGKKAAIDYKTQGLTMPQAESISKMSGSGLDSVMGNIGSYGPLVKEAKNLSPNESFIVKGEYAQNWFRLYLNSILIVVLIVAVLAIGLYFLSKFMNRKKGDGGKKDAAGEQESLNIAPPVFEVLNIFVGLLSAILVVGLTFTVRFLGQSVMPMYLYGIDPTLGILLMITVPLAYLLVIFGPAVFVAGKRGWQAMLFVIIAEFVWLLIFLVLYLILFGTGLTTPPIYRPMPVPMSSPVE